MESGQPSFVIPAAGYFSSTAVTALINECLPTPDDGSGGIQRLVARLPEALHVDRAYVAQLSADGMRFSVTQSAMGDWSDLLGYTQSVSRLPAFVRGSLKSGVQGTVEDAVTFPFTPQQRKMLYYLGLAATVLTPFKVGDRIGGALIVDALGSPRSWETSTLEACRQVADAIGSRLLRTQYGDYLSDEAPDLRRETPRMTVLANIARLVERAADPEVVTSDIADLLGALPWVESVRALPANERAGIVRDALAQERIIARAGVGAADHKTHLGIPLLYEGARFGGYEVTLIEPLTEVDEQFWRAVKTFAGSAYANALRRGRPRDGSLHDALTGLPNFRSINEQLIEAVHAAKSSKRPVAAWLVDIEKLDLVNRTAGYAVGDDVVGYVGATLGTFAVDRGGSAAGRVGGGMFLVVLPGMNDDEATVEARMIVERITKNAPGHLPTIALSLGVSSYPAQASNPDDLLRSARLALYAAKARGGNAVVVARAKDELWVRDARAAFVKIITEQQMPAGLSPLRK